MSKEPVMNAVPPYKKVAHDPHYGQVACAAAGGKLTTASRERLKHVSPYSIRVKVAIRYYNLYQQDPDYPFNRWEEQYNAIKELPIDDFFGAVYLGEPDLDPAGRRKKKGMQAKFLYIKTLLAAIRESEPAMHWDLQKRFDYYPAKVVTAKLRKAIKRGLVDGCCCGCRGDFRLTEKGKRAI